MQAMAMFMDIVFLNIIFQVKNKFELPKESYGLRALMSPEEILHSEESRGLLFVDGDIGGGVEGAHLLGRRHFVLA